MAIHQISVFLENRAGQLAEITALLAKNGVDLRAINIAETSDYGVLRLIASHEPEACRVLRENGFIFSTSDVVAVGVPDAPGGLSTLLQLLAENSIDVHYMYSIFGQPNGMALDVLVEMTPDHFSDSLAEITKREKGLVAALKAMLGIYAQVHLVSPKSIARSEGKAIRVIDKRKI